MTKNTGKEEKSKQKSCFRCIWMSRITIAVLIIVCLFLSKCVLDSLKNCSSLESITIPDSVTEIGKNMFMKCDSLKEISIDNTMEYVQERWKDVYSNMNLKSGTLIHCTDGDLQVN